MVRNRTIVAIGSLLVALLILLLAGGCANEKKEEPQPTAAVEKAPEAKPGPAEPEAVQTVCIYNNLTYWTDLDPEKRQRAGSLRKGELVMWLGKSEKSKDTAGNEQDYYLIKDAEGKESWALAQWLIPNSKPAAMTGETSIYEKKSLISKTSNKYEPMDIVAVLIEENDWVKVVGSSKDQENWIKPGSLTFAEVDIAVANQAYLMRLEKDENKKMEMLETLVEELASDTVLSNSIFTTMLQEQLEEMQEGEVMVIEVKPLN